MPDSTLPPAFLGAAPTLVGRADEQGRLREHLGAALAGHGSLVLIGGEAGIGKTALAEATLAEAIGRGALVLLGRCYDRTATPPYGPWRELVRAAPVDTALPPWPAALAPDEAGAHPAGPDALFDQVRDNLAARAAHRPLVLLVDDLHWADPASLDLLRVLGRQVADLPLLLLATYRSDELTRRHPLYQLLPLLLHEAPAALLDLAPLAEADTRALVATRYWLAAGDTARLVNYLHAHARGNPFYARELLRHLEEQRLLRTGGTGWQLADLAAVRLPALLRQVIDGRVARLGEEAARLLAMAAVVGQEVPLALWAAVSAVAEEALLDLIERAAEAHLLVATGTGAGVAFAHALVREALYEGVLPPRRRVWHRRVAEALLDLPNPDPDAVADHFRQAGDPRAVDWLVRAGERAQRAYAWLTAAERYEAALALLEACAGNAGRRGWLLLTLAQFQRYDDPGRGVTTLEKAIHLAAAAGDLPLSAAATFDQGHLRCLTGDVRQGVPQMEAAFAALEAVPPDARARLPAPQVQGAAADEEYYRGALILWLAHVGRYTDALALGAPMAERQSGTTARGLTGLAEVYAALGRVEEARRARTDARAAYQAAGQHHEVAQTWRGELDTLTLVYASEGAAERRHLVGEAERALRRASGVQADPTAAVVALRLRFLEGDWAAIRASLLARADAGGYHAWPIVGLLARAQGEPGLAWRMVRQLLPAGPAAVPGDGIFIASLLAQRLAAALALDAGDPGLARAWLAAHDRWVAWSGTVRGRAEGALGWATYHRAAGDLAQAREHAERALAHATEPRQPLALLAVHRALGELDTVATRHARAQAHLDTALSLANACAAPYERALTLLALATLRGAAGPRGDVAPLLAEVRATCLPLGAAPALARADALAATLAAPQYPDGLTTREVEVLRLYAANLSHREIGARLAIAPRTVGTHISNIYGKTGVTSRLAAARYAARHGLA